jgi:NAD(P)-dependent dehydrogenase (short-subunit alcohol dehydrogenase family)
VPGFDSYATSKQAVLAAALGLSRASPRLHINAVEPGLILNTGLGRDAPPAFRLLAKMLAPLLAPHIKYMSTPPRAGRLLTTLMLDGSGRAGVYYDEAGHPMPGSDLVRDPQFQDRVVAETRVLLSSVPV